MADTEKVEVLRPFNKTPQGNLAEIGEVLTVDKVRSGELQRLGLARPAKAAVAKKVTPKPANKMEPAPANKADDKSVKVRRTGASKRG